MYLITQLTWPYPLKSTMSPVSAHTSDSGTENVSYTHCQEVRGARTKIVDPHPAFPPPFLDKTIGHRDLRPVETN